MITAATVQRAPAPPWVEQLRLELGRGRHVLLTGNVADAYPVGDGFGDVRRAVTAVLRDHGCEIVGIHDVADGFAFDSEAGEDWFERSYEGHLARRRPQAPGAEVAADPRVQEADDGFAQAVSQRRSRRLAAPVDALSGIRWAVAQRDRHVGFVLDLADLTLPGSESPTPDEVRPLALLAHAVRGAAYIPVADGLRPRNSIVLVASEPSRALSRYVASEPQIAVIEVGVPGLAERRAYLTARAGQFYGAGELDVADQHRHAEMLTRLTDGLRTWDLEALRRTSIGEAAALSSPRRLTTRFALGRRATPWDETAPAVFAEAFALLSAQVLGQDSVIEAVCRRLRVARYGVGFDDESGRRERRPRATFFFAGPTGVGKTELAKALARLLFGDESALVTFDMTEYRDRASAARLTGSDPGFVGYEHGGQLVNAVRTRPFSILLFDEIEKAHPSVLDLFIGVLDEGRLTDGQGRTASFADSIVIFTSNAGAGELIERQREGPLDEAAVRRHFEQAVRDKLSHPESRGGINRPELLGRLRGGVLGFDILRPPLLAGLTEKLVAQWRANVQRSYGVRTVFPTHEFNELVADRLGDGALESGARTLEPHLRELLEEPLSELLAGEGLDARSTLTVSVDLGAGRTSFAVTPPRGSELDR